MNNMGNKFKYAVIAGALVLAPVLAAGPALAASDVATQGQVRTVIYTNSANVDLDSLLSGSGLNLSDLLKKLNLNNGIPLNNNNGSGTVTQAPVPSTPTPTKPVPTTPAQPAPTKPVPTQPTAPTQPSTGGNNNNQNVNNTSNFAAQVVDLVNKERANAGLAPLKSDAGLTNVAMIKAKDMYDNNYFDHNSPTLGSPFDLMTAQGVQYRSAGENIAKGQRTPQEVMTAWMNSDGHRKNILNTSYTSIGVAYYNGEWVQEFKG